MRAVFRVLMFACLASIAQMAAALPPPIPLSITIVSYWPDDSPQHNHARMLVDAIVDQNWIKPVPAELPLTPEQKRECIAKGSDAAACLRSLNAGRYLRLPGAPAHVILFVTGETHNAKITCIGGGQHARNAAAQRISIDIKAALFARPEEQRPHRAAATSCLLNAQSEVP